MSAEWVPGEWDRVTVGQTVCLRNADGAEVEIVAADRSPLTYSGNQWVSSSSCRYLTCEWDLFVSRHEPPTESGLYRLDSGMVVERCAHQAWMSPNHSSGVAEFVRGSRSFTRLVPQANITHADLVDLFEAHADEHDDRYWIPVEVAVDLILDHPDLAALIRPEPIRTANTPEKGIAPA